MYIFFSQFRLFIFRYSVTFLWATFCILTNENVLLEKYNKSQTIKFWDIRKTMKLYVTFLFLRNIINIKLREVQYQLY